MGVYPPGDNVMYKVCQSFQDHSLSSTETLKAYFTAQAIADYDDSNGCEGPASSSKVCSKEAEDTYLEDMFVGDCKDICSNFDPGPLNAPVKHLNMTNSMGMNMTAVKAGISRHEHT